MSVVCDIKGAVWKKRDWTCYALWTVEFYPRKKIILVGHYHVGTISVEWANPSLLPWRARSEFSHSTYEVDYGVDLRVSPW
eukprot:g80869.t1